MRFCVINVGGFCYTAFSPSTCEAVADALKRFPNATSVSVRTRLKLALPVMAKASNDVPCLTRRHAEGENGGYARLAVTSDATGQAAWGQSLTYCAPSLH